MSKKTRAGVAANLGKARAYNRAGGPAPPGIAALGAGVWHGDADETERGFVALGTPIGHPLYVAAHTDARSLEEARLLHELPMLPDLQCAWLLLAMCASPRADHLLHTLPPDLSAGYARGHDDAIWQCLLALRAKLTTPTLTSLRHAGSRCCLRVWEVWGCSAPNAPQHTGPPGSTPCPSCELVAPMPLSAASPSSVPVQLLLPPACEPLQRLDARSTVPDGKAALPGTTCTMACALHNAICLNLVRGARAGSTTALALALPTSARPSCCLPCHPLARPCCVRNLGRTQLSAVPSEACGGGCGCPCRSLPTDVAHRGTVAALSTPTVTTTPRALAPDCPAAVVGAHVRPSRRPSRSPPPRLCRVRGYTAWRGVVLRCHPRGASDSRGEAQPSAASRDGAAITVAERRKRAAYPELLRPGPQRLCVLACEVGGRWSSESLRLVSQAGLAAPLVGFLERGFAKHRCCHAARSTVRRWRTARCPAPAAGGRTARRSPSYPSLLGP